MNTVILGASRGLGYELSKTAASQGARVTGFARKGELLATLEQEFQSFSARIADFTRPEGQQTVLSYLTEQPIDKIFYVAGGGPYGPFEKPDWKDHEWAWEVTFKFPAKILHTLARMPQKPQIILVGSSIAEADGDPKAASYASAKHALRGLQQSLNKENPEWDVRLFSPGYMDTDMLPASAPVRAQGVYSPRQIAEELWSWSLDPSARTKTYPKHPR